MFPQIIVRKAFPSKPIICAMWIVNEELGGWVGVRDGGGGAPQVLLVNVVNG